MNTTSIKGAISNGAARIRKLAGGWTLIDIRNAETTLVVANATRLFDLSRCRRLSRGAAHRIVNAMADASEAVKAHYHQLIDATKEGEVQT